jgi:hypothetical protein
VARRVWLYKAALLLAALGIGALIGTVMNLASPLVPVGLALFLAAVVAYRLAARGPGGFPAVGFANRSRMYRADSVTVGLRDSPKARATLSAWIDVAREHGYAPAGELQTDRTSLGPVVKLVLAKAPPETQGAPRDIA